MLLKFRDSNLNIRLDGIIKHSKPLANDINTCYQTFLNNQCKWNYQESTISKGIRAITTQFENLLIELDKHTKKALLKNGLSALENEIVWLNIESAFFNTYNHSEEKRFLTILNNSFLLLARLFHNDSDLVSPSTIKVKGIFINTLKLYKASYLLMNQYQMFIRYLEDSGKTQREIKRIKASTHAILNELIQIEKYRKLLAEVGLRTFVYDEHILQEVLKSKMYTGKHFEIFLKHIDSIAFANFDSKTFGKKTIVYKGDNKLDLTTLHNTSTTLFEELNNFSKVIGHSVDTHLSRGSIRDRFSEFTRAIGILQTKLTDDLYQEFLKNGVRVLICNNNLKQLYNDQDVPRWVILSIHRICLYIYPKETPEIVTLHDNLLSFPSVSENRDPLSDFSIIKNISELLFDDFKNLLEELINDIDLKVYSMISVYHNYQQIKSLLVKYKDSFSEPHLEILRKHGLKSFGIKDGLIQKHLLAQLQASVLNGSFNRSTAITYRSSFIWFLHELNIPYYEIYPINNSKAVKYQERLNSQDFYSENECRELAFHIEKLLSDDSTSLNVRILLLFGKVILKTGWNISPLLKLECEDIVQIESPITNKSEFAVVLQKARAGYRNDTYIFEKNELQADAYKSAITDLLIVRDELTSHLRTQTKEHSNYVFIIPSKETVIKLEYSHLKRLSAILNAVGCNVNFIARKIRKGGLNYIYRKVQKNISSYINIANHSFETFESNYLRIDPNQSRYTLNQATKVMSDYFTGKDISSVIQIITDNSTEHTQIIPAGVCASKEGSEEAVRYNKEHRKLHQDNDTNVLNLCADFLSCIWCKYYRVVVDSEHVWKLLSYKNYILLNMELSVVDFHDTNNQISSINILKQRVDEIISSLKERDNKAVCEGYALIKQHGIHPDWEFAFPSMPLSIGEL
ncbi:hypothetical protein RT723_04620 [Psychrosphaera aquimarina]|uniref:Uncharacterized protein n=1 Tax=Psychrosphaera aquimarina TaxID=2044854 RepID=A0ABU3QXY1_9GAMM|nr:hypothetical protein [Psychrosphaera aquimarina]MDU0112292.1 hypothetical protein [Psychrosphaera aquimarina]